MIKIYKKYEKIYKNDYQIDCLSHLELDPRDLDDKLK